MVKLAPQTEKEYNRIEAQIDQETKQLHPPLFVFESATITLCEWAKRIES